MSSALTIPQSFRASTYGDELRSIFRRAREIIDTDLATQKEPQVWDKIRRDPICAQAIDIRTNNIAGDDFMVVPPKNPTPQEERLASIVQDALAEIDLFQSAQRLLAAGVFRARSYAFVESEERNIQLGQEGARPWRVPTRLVDIDKERVKKLDRNRVNARSRVRAGADPDWRWYLETRKKTDPKLIDFRRDPIVRMVWFNEERRLGFGYPLIESLYFYWWMKAEGLPLMLAALDRFALGIVNYKFDPNGPAGGTGKDAQSYRDDVLDQLKKNRTEHFLVSPMGDEIEILTGGAEGSNMTVKLIEYCDRGIARAANGSVLPLGGEQGHGSKARAEVEDSVSQSLTKSDRDHKDEAAGGKLISLFCEWNRSTIFSLGLGGARKPKFKTSDVKKEDPVENAQVASILLSQGVPLKREELYERTGWTPPDEKDKAITGRVMVPGASGAEFGGGLPRLDVPSFLPKDIGEPAPEKPGALDPGDSPEDQKESELLGKVGGITGALDILEKLSLNVITRETAVQMMVVFFHLTEQQANKLIGESGKEPVVDPRAQPQPPEVAGAPEISGP